MFTISIPILAFDFIFTTFICHFKVMLLFLKAGPFIISVIFLNVLLSCLVAHFQF